MTRLLPLFLAISISFAGAYSPLHPGEARAETTMQRIGNPAERERQAERVKRFLQWTVDDLNFSRKVTQEDIGELEEQYDAITPLESVQMEADLLSLIDTHYSYIDWLNDRSEEFEEDLAEISADSIPGSEFLENSFADMVSMLKEQQKVLSEKINRFGTEKKRLATSLERRLFLLTQISDLEVKLRMLDDMDNVEKTMIKGIRRRILEIQKEIDSLPRVDEDALMYYMLLIEQGRGESEWLSLQIDELGMLREVAAILPRDTSRNALELDKAIRGTVRSYENEIKLLKRRIDDLDKSRSSITPAGTIRETERSRDLADLYERMQLRYNDLVNRIRIRIGAWQAEAAGLMSSGE